MQIATITPIYDLDLSDSFSHFYLVLQWLCAEDPQYKAHFTSIHQKYTDAYTILDNGANESRLCNYEDLLSTADDIKADEIVCPDEFLQSQGTIDKTTEFLDKYYESRIKGKFKTMAVLQGKDEKTFMKCYNAFLKDDRINILGVGYRNLMRPFKEQIEGFGFNGLNKEYLKSKLENDCYYYTLSRIYFLRHIINFKDLEKYNKTIHLLGSYNPFEMSLYKEPLFFNKELLYIRGWDTACATQAAQMGVTFDETFGVKDKPMAILDFERHLDGNTRRLVEKNIEVIKKWIK